MGPENSRALRGVVSVILEGTTSKRQNFRILGCMQLT